MKKPIEAKRVFAAVCIITIVLLTFPASSFGWDGCVFGNRGDIFGLVFDFGEEGLEFDLREFGLPLLYVTDVEVRGSGREKSFITPFHQFIYQTKLVDGWGDLKKGRIIAYLKDGGEGTPEYLIFKFNKVRLFETYYVNEAAADFSCQNDIEPDVPVDPTQVDIYFEVRKAKLVGMPGIKFNLLLKIDGGFPTLTIVGIP